MYFTKHAELKISIYGLEAEFILKELITNFTHVLTSLKTV